MAKQRKEAPPHRVADPKVFVGAGVRIDKLKPIENFDEDSYIQRIELAEVAQPGVEYKTTKNKRTADNQALIVKYIEQGMSNVDAVGLAGVSQNSFYTWQKTDPLFRDRCVAAHHEFKRRHLSNIGQHAAVDWKASAWLLSRKFPDEFGEKREIKIQQEGPTAQNIVIAFLGQINEAKGYVAPEAISQDVTKIITNPIAVDAAIADDEEPEDD